MTAVEKFDGMINMLDNVILLKHNCKIPKDKFKLFRYNVYIKSFKNQSEIARFLGVSQTTIHKNLKGKIEFIKNEYRVEPIE